ncbi:YceI family protein [Streptomyces sp. NPDC059373]
MLRRGRRIDRVCLSRVLGRRASTVLRGLRCSNAPQATRGRLTFTLDATSLRAGRPLLDRRLRGPRGLDVERHPRVRFTAEELKHQEDGDRPRGCLDCMPAAVRTCARPRLHRTPRRPHHGG